MNLRTRSRLRQRNLWLRPWVPVALVCSLSISNASPTHSTTGPATATIGSPVLGVHSFGNGAEIGTRHPMDGPDAELRLLRTTAGLRLAVRVNLAWLDDRFDEPRELPGEIVEEERIILEGLAWQWVQDEALLRVSGEALQGRLESVAWVEPDPERIPYFPRNGARALTYLDLIATYAPEASLEMVTLHWSAYPINPVLAGPNHAPTVEVKAVLMAGAEERIVALTKEQPSYKWRLPQSAGADHLLPLPAAPPVPIERNIGIMYALAAGATLSSILVLRAHRARLLLSLAAIGTLLFLYTRQPNATPELKIESAQEVFHALHQNMYRAFDFHEQELVYDALDQTLEGELLERLYTEIHASLVLEEEGGALCRVESVTPLDVQINLTQGVPHAGSQLKSRAPFRASALWRLDGVMHHWGHSHRRRQEIRADFDVAYTEQGWRMIGAQNIESKRLPVLEPEDAPDGSPAKIDDTSF